MQTGLLLYFSGIVGAAGKNGTFVGVSVFKRLVTIHISASAPFMISDCFSFCTSA